MCCNARFHGSRCAQPQDHGEQLHFYLLVTTFRCTFRASTNVLRLEGQMKLKHLITKSKLAVAVAVLCLFASVPPAHADTLLIQPDYELRIPDGSTITSVNIVV